MPAAVPGAAAPTVTAGDDMQVPTPAMVAPDEVQAVAVPEPSVASTPTMDASASAAPAASMVAVPATKATIISREASTASDALPLHRRRLEERRVGKEGDSTGRIRGSPDH